MAKRDRSQGFGFVYLDLTKFVAQRNELDKKHSDVYPPLDAPTVNFNKDPQLVPLHQEPSTRAQAISQIRENLDRLQALHHKLHAMLEDLNHLTTKKKSE